MWGKQKHAATPICPCLLHVSGVLEGGGTQSGSNSLVPWLGLEAAVIHDSYAGHALLLTVLKVSIIAVLSNEHVLCIQ